MFFWQNIRDGGGFRLTDQGHAYLTNVLEVESWPIDLKDYEVNGKFLLELDKFLDCPYHVRLGRWPKVSIYDEKAVFWLTLNNQNFEKFLNAYKKSGVRRN